MDSFRLESLPRCIFNVLTYSVLGPGFLPAPPIIYRASGCHPHQQPFSGEKLNHVAKTTSRAAQQRGRQPRGSRVPPEDPHHRRKARGRECCRQRPPASTASQGPSADPRLLWRSACTALSGGLEDAHMEVCSECPSVSCIQKMRTPLTVVRACFPEPSSPRQLPMCPPCPKQANKNRTHFCSELVLAIVSTPTTSKCLCVPQTTPGPSQRACCLHSHFR